MKTTADLVAMILNAKKHPEPGYGGNVMPAARIYSELTSGGEIRNYQQALERLLQHEDSEIRQFTVNLCLGFHAFADVIKQPNLSQGDGDGL